MNFKKIRMIFNCSLLSKRTVSFLTTFMFLVNAVFAAGNPAQKKSITNAPLNPAYVDSEIFVRDFKYFREFYYKDAKILINKTNSKTKNIIFSRGQTNLSITQNDDKAIYEYMVPGKSMRHYLVYKFEKNKPTKVGYYTVNRTTYFSDSSSAMPAAGISAESDSGTCSARPDWGFGELREIAKAIEGEGVFGADSSLDIKKLIDKETCNMSQRNIVNSVVTNLFDKNGAKILKCLQTDSAQKKLESDKALLASANLFVARLTSFLDEQTRKKVIKNNVLNQSEFKIKCKMEPSDKESSSKDKNGKVVEGKVKSACFSDDFSNPEIRLNFDGPPILNANKEIDSVKLEHEIMHEFYHSSASQMQIEGKPNCIDEQIVKNLENLCDPKELGKVEDGVKGCGVSDINKIDKSQKSTLDGKGEFELNLHASKMPLSEDVSPSKNPNDVVLLPNSEVAALANASLPKSSNAGEKIQLSNNSSISDSLGSIYTSISNSANGMGKVLTNAAKLSVSNANAANANALPAATLNQYTYPPGQIVADKYKADLNSEPVLIKNNTWANVQNSSQTVRASEKMNQINDSKVNNLNSAADNRKPAHAATSDAATVMPTTALGGTEQKRSIASISPVTAKTNSESSVNLKTVGTNESQIIQSLSAFNKLSGKNYAEVVKQYPNGDFNKLLKQRGISIEVQTEQNQKSKLRFGATENIKVKFLDDGKNLNKINE